MTTSSPGEPPGEPLGEPPEGRDGGRPLPWGPDAPIESPPPKVDTEPQPEPQSEHAPEREYDPRFGGPGLRWRGDGALRPTEAPAPLDRPVADRIPTDPVAAARYEAMFDPDRPGIAGRPYATFQRRLAAWLIDFLIRVVLLWIVIAIVGIETPDDPFALSGPLFGTMQSLNLMYGWIFTTQGWTPGMRILHMRIVREDGLTAPGPWWAVVRVLGAFLSELAFFVGYLWMLRDSRNQTWHDKMARTYVVMAREEDYERRR